MIDPGETIRALDFGNHLYIVITGELSDGTIVLVNFTSHGRPGRTDHRRCLVVGPSEHPWLRHDSCVNYRRAIFNPLAPLVRAKRAGELSQHERCTPELLRRIQEGALVSRETPREIREAVRATLAGGG